MIDFAASLPHYVDHLQPIWEALDEAERGTWWCRSTMVQQLARRGIAARAGKPPVGDPRTLVVAGFADVRANRTQRLVLVEHGAGQSYDVDDGAYSGGRGRDTVGLFVVPNQHVAARNDARYPETSSLVVGSPRVDALHRMPRCSGRAVALSFHWRCDLSPEAGWAFPHYEAALPGIVADLRADGFEVLGHGHPRYAKFFGRLWERLGVEHVADFVDVVARAGVYVCDNSSTLFEAAACGIPVVVLNAPWYRRDADLWPRFWACADVGVQVDEPGQVAEAVRYALTDSSDVAERRRQRVAEVYGDLDGGVAERAADAIRRFAACKASPLVV